jgi:hypothetical protein
VHPFATLLTAVLETACAVTRYALSTRKGLHPDSTDPR